MSKKALSIIVALIVVAILAIIVADFISKRPDRLGSNPYALDVSEYEDVEASLIHYKETKNIPVSELKPGGIDVDGDEIYLTGEKFLQVISKKGVQQLLIELDGEGTCVAASADKIYVGFSDHVVVYSNKGEELAAWAALDSRCVITSMAIMDDVLYVADAGNRRVLRYDAAGQILGEFVGKAESAAGHGFIVPSPNFDLVVNSFGELWVVNPGKHAIENYSDEGMMRGYWQNSSTDIEGFTGCCNPAEITVMEDGSFVTSEKGLVRIKIYDQSGKLLSVVAAPEKFQEEGKAPEVAVDSEGNIYALDFDKNMIRIFEKK